MRTMHELAEILQNIISEWILNSNESGLESAIDSTVKGGYFEKSDVEYALKQLSLSIQRDELIEWVSKNTTEHSLNTEIFNENRSRKILCLHAGNLPLVGMQDMLAVLVSGAQYFGKISRKDPFLLPSLLKYIQTQSAIFKIDFSVDISDFKDQYIPEWMFAGSEDSLESLKLTLEKNSIISSEEQRSLIRTANFSVAVIDHWNSKICTDLIESIFRFGGRGCRSVAVVYSNFNLIEISKDLKDESENWLKRNEYPVNLSPSVKIRSAYNDAVGINQVSIGNAIIQEGVVTIDNPGIIYWQPLTDLIDVNLRYGHHLQQIYFVHESNEIHSKLVDNSKCDFLEYAQCPNLWWRPDGIDVLNWILSKLYDR